MKKSNTRSTDRELAIDAFEPSTFPNGPIHHIFFAIF